MSPTTSGTTRPRSDPRALAEYRRQRDRWFSAFEAACRALDLGNAVALEAADAEMNASFEVSLPLMPLLAPRDLW